MEKLTEQELKDVDLIKAKDKEISLFLLENNIAYEYEFGFTLLGSINAETFKELTNKFICELYSSKVVIYGSINAGFN